MPNDVKLLKTQKWSKKKIFKNFEMWRHLKWRADGHVIRSDVTSQVTSIKIQVTIISSSDEQMARASVITGLRAKNAFTILKSQK